MNMHTHIPAGEPVPSSVYPQMTVRPAPATSAGVAEAAAEPMVILLRRVRAAERAYSELPEDLSTEEEMCAAEDILDEPWNKLVDETPPVTSAADAVAALHFLAEEVYPSSPALKPLLKAVETFLEALPSGDADAAELLAIGSQITDLKHRINENCIEHNTMLPECDRAFAAFGDTDKYKAWKIESGLDAIEAEYCSLDEDCGRLVRQALAIRPTTLAGAAMQARIVKWENPVLFRREVDDFDTGEKEIVDFVNNLLPVEAGQ